MSSFLSIQLTLFFCTGKYDAVAAPWNIEVQRSLNERNLMR
jgi:hypothetical protein